MKTKQYSINLSVLTILALTIAFGIGNSSQVFADRGGVYTPHDINRDGFLDKEEFKIFIEKRRVKQEYAHLWVFDDVDMDKDGKISREEMSRSLNQEMRLRLEKKSRKPNP
ncbi:MAG: EF-hand domain-containing protein [Sedimenticola sp.]|nr:EF-hand domain-containing protein [Sedimenticola sp.]MCW8974876.1 EF-hand domain-containing protein [Sedimenticola sp.]